MTIADAVPRPLSADQLLPRLDPSIPGLRSSTRASLVPPHMRLCSAPPDRVLGEAARATPAAGKASLVATRGTRGYHTPPSLARKCSSMDEQPGGGGSEQLDGRAKACGSFLRQRAPTGGRPGRLRLSSAPPPIPGHGSPPPVHHLLDYPI